MKSISMPGLRVMMRLLLVVALMLPGFAALVVPTSADPVEDSTITITFAGLMVFDKAVRGSVTVGGMLVGGTQKIWLHSQAAHHKLTIQIKGPGFDDEFIDWLESYESDLELKLDVVNLNGVPMNSPRWPAAVPFLIDGLHPAVGDQRLVMNPERLGPSITINAGTFTADLPQNITFQSLDNPRGIPVPAVPRRVIDSIPLSASQKAVLSVIGRPTLFEMTGGPWEIRVRNNPDLLTACERDDHFQHYYDGFGILQDGYETPIDPRQKFKAIIPGSGSCKKGHFVLPTRPCIPISH